MKIQRNKTFGFLGITVGIKFNVPIMSTDLKSGGGDVIADTFGLVN